MQLHRRDSLSSVKPFLSLQRCPEGIFLFFREGKEIMRCDELLTLISAKRLHWRVVLEIVKRSSVSDLAICTHSERRVTRANIVALNQLGDSRSENMRCRCHGSILSFVMG